MNEHFQSIKYIATTYIATALDPIHIGTGGYKIGRVDNSVIRDFDDVPKIPGTSIAGAIRSYAAMHFTKWECAGKDDATTNGGGRQCGNDDCPICVTFGYTRDTTSRSSMVSFSDARILFFPVSTMIGPVWITSPSRLKKFAGIDCGLNDDEKFCAVEEIGLPPDNRLNLGWVLLTKLENGTGLSLANNKFETINPQIKKKAVCITDTLFTLIVNSNLEVRTSVSINPFTGAAIEGALFTYEGVPRTTVFWFDAIIQDYSKFKGGDKTVTYCNEVKKIYNDLPEKNKDSIAITDEDCIKASKRVIQSGINYCDKLGIGGMNTRGFGRIEIKEVEQ